ncbi:5-carboxymethyl-2-hydroxymuconate isomerase [uncultured Sulfitobacter sp.]|uniref:5-carboxymethyl-2-hydroxymuconate isomerase n=1 Tax=uncultured Sulfitobacter sp. TaxID=191468 RepID=UPI002627924B|nr:5-carboxymethyl-2-hydroxymuconate isomerase [uncultured Sulfitobacter sp.]
MPHITLEYSPNLESHLDIHALCITLKNAAAATNVFPPAGIRVRAIACTHVVIADGDPQHGFIDINIRLRAGRTVEAKTAATNAIFAAATDFTAAYMAAHPFMLSLEMRNIDADLSRKTSSIRDYLPEDMA